MHFRHLMSVHFQTLYFFHRFRTLQVINVSATFTKKMGMNGSICIKISIFLINCCLLYTSTGTEELFDLSKDPHELKNVVTDKKYKQQLNELRQAMIDHLSERGEKFVKDGKLQVLKQTILYLSLIHI